MHFALTEISAEVDEIFEAFFIDWHAPEFPSDMLKPIQAVGTGYYLILKHLERVRKHAERNREVSSLFYEGFNSEKDAQNSR